MSDLWITASQDAEGENHDKLFTSLRIEASAYWPVLAGAGSTLDFENRLALVTPQLDAIVSNRCDDMGSRIAYKDELVAALTADFEILASSRTAKEEEEDLSKPPAHPATLGSHKTAGPSGTSRDIIGYTYDADVHCPGCAIAKFGQEPGRYWVKEDAEDSEGNEVHPIFQWDETSEEGEHCGTCGGEIAPAWGSGYGELDEDEGPASDPNQGSFFGSKDPAESDNWINYLCDECGKKHQKGKHKKHAVYTPCNSCGTPLPADGKTASIKVCDECRGQR
jgi:hypothetical protein